jgi:hypothetical protein
MTIDKSLQASLSTVKGRHRNRYDIKAEEIHPDGLGRLGQSGG